MLTSRFRQLFVGGCVFAIAACEGSPTEPEPFPAAPPDVREYVTGAALENLDTNGHFQLSPAVLETPYAILSAQKAEAIALGVIRTWYANPDARTVGDLSLVEAAENVHGAPIDWDNVQHGDRTGYFAESHLVPLPDSLGNPAIRHFGPHYLIPLYVGATPVVVVGISAYAKNLFVDDRSFIRRTDDLDQGGEFAVAGVPLLLNGVTVPPAPEVAVEFAYLATGSKISSVPVLGVPGNRIIRTAARWQLRLAEPVEFERLVDGAEVITQDVYVGLFESIADARVNASATSVTPQLRMYVAADTQPEAEDLGGHQVPLRPGYEVDLHEVTARD